MSELKVISNKVANLINGSRGMDRDYRVILVSQYEQIKNEPVKKEYRLRMTIVVKPDGEYVKHYWG